jgi:activator of 2-hydroxyglutaryl-CoA dehydratase
MSIYISVDSGTTNTRIALVKDNKIIKTLKYNVGASKSIGEALCLKMPLRKE